MERLVKPLANPLPSEMAATIGTQLDPYFYFLAPTSGAGVQPPAQRRKRDEAEDARYYQAPQGALVFHGKKNTSTTWPEHTTKALSVVFVPKDAAGRSAFTGPLQVLGVVASPIEDPGLVARHQEELAHIAVYVTGAHTILADPDDCKTLFPMMYIGVQWDTASFPWSRLDTGGDMPFYVPRFKIAPPKEAFALVLQVGTSELRILLLSHRFRD